jgi:hypothetical protein
VVLLSPQNIYLIFQKGFVLGVDRFDSHLFSSRSFTRTQDLLLQKMMGIQVRVEDGADVVGPCPNALSDGRLVPTNATRIFTALCGYRLVDIISHLGETYPPATVIERTPAPTGPLQVRTFNSFALCGTHNRSQCLPDLKNWISLLNRFKTLLTTEKSPIGPPCLKSGPDGLHVPIALLRNISRFDAVSKCAKIAENFLTAAMHLAYLRCSATREDLPDSAQALISQ